MLVLAILVSYGHNKDGKGVAEAYLCQILLVRHDHIMLKSDNDILVGSIFEIIRHHSRIVLFDRVIIGPALFQTSEIPCDHVFASGCNYGLFSLVDTRIESGWGE